MWSSPHTKRQSKCCAHSTAALSPIQTRYSVSTGLLLALGKSQQTVSPYISAAPRTILNPPFDVLCRPVEGSAKPYMLPETSCLLFCLVRQCCRAMAAHAKPFLHRLMPVAVSCHHTCGSVDKTVPVHSAHSEADACPVQLITLSLLETWRQT